MRASEVTNFYLPSAFSILSSQFLVVGAEGLEPTRTSAHRLLRPARLPVSPRSRLPAINCPLHSGFRQPDSPGLRPVFAGPTLVLLLSEGWPPASSGGPARSRACGRRPARRGVGAACRDVRDDV